MVMIAPRGDEQGRTSIVSYDIEAENTAVEFLRLRQIRHMKMHVTYSRTHRQSSPFHTFRCGKESIYINRVSRHHIMTLFITLPSLPWTVRVYLDTVVVRIIDIDRLADKVIPLTYRSLMFD
ncbi:hypothetical protein D3C85_1592730 [compost metagenome]